MEPNGSAIVSGFQLTLSKLYPVEEFATVLLPTSSEPIAPRFCWRFYQAEISGYKNFVDTVLSYRGTIRWTFFPGSGGLTCLVPSPSPDVSVPFAGYPPLKASDSVAATYYVLNGQNEFVNQALSDLNRLTSYIERKLNLAVVASRTFDPSAIAAAGPPPVTTLIDFFERGMQVTWIIPENSKSGTRTMLHFGLTDGEWHAIHSAFLSAQTGDPTSELPTLSKFRAYETVDFSPDEVDKLRAECVRLRARTSEWIVIRALDKMILMCNWAKSVEGRIHLSGP